MVLRVAERGYFGFYTEARFPVFLTRRENLTRWDRLKWRDIAVQIQRPVGTITYLTCSRVAFIYINFFHVQRVYCNKSPRSIRKTRVR